MSGFVHSQKLTTSTMSELLRIHGVVSPDRFFGGYAYATQSGFRTFELAVGDDFWTQTSSRWLFGFDYGRTDPRALRAIDDRANTEIRIYDGAFVVEREGFEPRRDYHAKAAIMENTATHRWGTVVGSGNFSNNGLRRSVEAGTATVAKSVKAVEQRIRHLTDGFERLWASSTPLADVIDDYEARKELQAADIDLRKPTGVATSLTAFWLEAGYVTKNRGDDSPGNQIWFPGGFRTFFGFSMNPNEPKNALIGTVTLTPSIGPPVTNNLRRNANGMEKMSLPIPETHGFGVYDGKILVFRPAGGGAFHISAFEEGEFDMIYGHRLVNIQRMNGGRRYGAII